TLRNLTRNQQTTGGLNRRGCLARPADLSSKVGRLALVGGGATQLGEEEGPPNRDGAGRAPSRLTRRPGAGTRPLNGLTKRPGAGTRQIPKAEAKLQRPAAAA